MAKKEIKIDDIPQESNVSIESNLPIPDDFEPKVPVNNIIPSDDESKTKLSISGKIKKVWKIYNSNKKLSYPVTTLVVVAIIFALPTTRYGVLGLVVNRDIRVKIVDTQTNVPVSGVEIAIHGRTAKTDGEGSATIQNVKVGNGELKASKNHYKETVSSVTVGLSLNQFELKLDATGRQIPINIINKITGENITGAVITLPDTSAETDKNGLTTLVLPVNLPVAEAVITKDGYNSQTIKISNSSQINENTYGLTPVGKIYFLSKASGKIDVVKTNLDGSDRQIVLAGSGLEQDTNTSLIASSDWKYLALHARREDSKPMLYVIDTSNDEYAEIDSGNVAFTNVGWSGHNFIYTLSRNNVNLWQPKSSALKSYNAVSKQLITIDETNAEGLGENDYALESITNVKILRDKLIYTKQWYASYFSAYRLAGKRMDIYLVNSSGANKKSLKDFDVANNGFINIVVPMPNTAYVLVQNSIKSIFQFKNNELTVATNITDKALEKDYPVYLFSPSGTKTYWHEQGDGKNTLFVGNIDGISSSPLTSQGEFVPYGWFGDDYILMSKNNSELYVQPSEQKKDGKVIKISDYHKPTYEYYGYGGL